MPESGYQEALFHAACGYMARGYSVIPVYGDADPERAKVAAVSWSVYQHSRCTAMEAQRWICERRYAGVAIVTGRVSRLAVLDFDSSERFRDFQRQHPDLTETYMVETRRGVHLYFKVFPYVVVESRKAMGVDLQFEGRYVVAPPTVIDDHRYRITNERMPKAVTEGDVQRIYAFLGAITQESAPTTVFAASICHSEASSSGVTEQITPGDLVALYRDMVPRLGRNEALFHVCRRARDSGWPHETVVASLADLHAEQRSHRQHRNESREQRYREAVHTIKSAFSRPPRPRSWSDIYDQTQLFNSIREVLLQLKQTGTVRVLEGLLQAAIMPGHPLTTSKVELLLKGQVGRDTIHKALRATTPSGENIFSRAIPTPDNPTLADADNDRGKAPTKNCFFVREQKSGKSPRHRPARVFIMPSNLELCERLGVKPSRSDPISADDLRSAKLTRQAVHRELIKRRPGSYTRMWLAERLGISIRTLDTYNHEIPIHRREVYQIIPVSWATLNHVPAGFEVDGAFLEDQLGKRYPARQEIAIRLLCRKKRLIYKRRRPNYYFYGEEPPDLASQLTLYPPWLEAQASRIQLKMDTDAAMCERPLIFKEAEAQPLEPAFPAKPNNSLTTTSVMAPVKEAPTAQLFQAAPEPKKPGKRYFRKPLANQRMERLARQVHDETNPSPYGNTHGMSIYNARRLVYTFGIQPVETALKSMLWMRKWDKLTNAAGFIKTVSRIEWRKLHGFGVPAPRFPGEPTRKGRTRYKSASKDPLSRSELYLRWRAQRHEERGEWEEASYWRSKIKRKLDW